MIKNPIKPGEMIKCDKNTTFGKNNKKTDVNVNRLFLRVLLIPCL